MSGQNAGINLNPIRRKTADYLTGFKKPKMSLILPRDDVTMIGKIYKSAYDSLLYNEKEFQKRIDEIKYLGSYDRLSDIPKHIILPFSKLITLWDFIIFLFCLITIIFIPLELGYFLLDRFKRAGYINGTIITEYIITSCIFLDVIFNFFRAIPTSKGKMILDSKEIRSKYLKGAFVIDFISFIRVDFIYMHTQFISIFIRIMLRIPRFLRIYRVFVYLARFKNSKILNIIKLFFIYYLITHYFSCAIFYTSSFAEYNYILTADNLNAVLSTSNFSVDYAKYTLDSICTLCGNDIGPVNFTQRVLLTIMFYIGTMCDAIIFGNMAIFFAKSESFEKEKNRKSDELILFLSTLEVNSVVKKEIMDYQETLWWKNREKFLNKNFMRELNQFLKTRIKILKLTDNYLDICPFINIISEQFLRKFCTKLKLLITHPNDIITFEGSVDRKIYFIAKKGKCSVKINGNIVKILYEGDIFGEISCFIKSSVRIATVTSVHVSSLYYLEEHVVDAIFYDFPVEAKYFFKIAFERFNESLKFMSDDLKKKIWSYDGKGEDSDSIWIDDVVEMLKNKA